MEQPIGQFNSSPTSKSPLIPIIVSVVLTAIVAGGGIFWWTYQKQQALNNEIVGWQSHSNADIGFSFKYPQTWKVEDGLKVNTCCLNLFSSVNPYQGDFLKQNVMKAQFKYHVDASISNKQQYIDSLVKGSTESEMGSPINKSSIVSVQNENGLDIFKFSGGVGSISYIIPRKANFSEVIYVIVWNPDSTLEKVLSTLSPTSQTSKSGWTMYSGAGFGIQYPENTFAVVQVTKQLPSDYKNNYAGVKLISSLDSSLKTNVTLAGKQIVRWSIGAEGEGIDYYYIPLNPNQTLVVARHYRFDGFPQQTLFNQVLDTLVITPTPTTQSQTYRGVAFSVNYPKSWIIQNQDCSDLSGTDCTNLAPTATIAYYKQKYGNDSLSLAGFSAHKTSQTPREWLGTIIGSGSFAEDKQMTINGYSAAFVKSVAPKTYTDYYYAVASKGTVVYFVFRSYSESHPYRQSVQIDDYSQYLSDFQSIVNSIKFN